MSIRLAIGQFKELTEEKLRFAAQTGVAGVQMNNPHLPGDVRWEVDDIRPLVEKAKAYGLVFEAIENVPAQFYNKAMLGLEGRDEQIENYQHTIRSVARAGIPVLGYHFTPNGVWTTDRKTATRGGAMARTFDMSLIEAGRDDADTLRGFLPTGLGQTQALPLYTGDKDVITAEQMWENYAYFIKAVLPVAEEEGIRLALHPDDPPVESLGGVARIFNRTDNFKKAHAIADGSPAWALDLCLGCCSEMPGGAKNVFEMIEHFGPLGVIAYVHFRDVQGTVPTFTECFIGDGNFNPAQAMAALARNGFDGFIIDDHVPVMDDDTDWKHRGRAHAIGYMQGLIRMGEYARAFT
jgi:mannonate dehydratase